MNGIKVAGEVSDEDVGETEEMLSKVHLKDNLVNGKLPNGNGILAADIIH